MEVPSLTRSATRQIGPMATKLSGFKNSLVAIIYFTSECLQSVWCWLLQLELSKNKSLNWNHQLSWHQPKELKWTWNTICHSLSELSTRSQLWFLMWGSSRETWVRRRFQLTTPCSRMMTGRQLSSTCVLTNRLTTLKSMRTSSQHPRLNMQLNAPSTSGRAMEKLMSTFCSLAQAKHT